MKTTLCYIEQDGCYLMLLRNKKAHDANAGKWVGVGGKFLPGESPEACLVREVREETGWTLSSWDFRGIIHFENDSWPDEDMYLFTAVSPEAEVTCVPECDEGTFAWVPKEEVMHLELWEGDRIFLARLLADDHGLDLGLIYHKDRLIRVDEPRGCAMQE